jgi:hypothetical protein
MRCRRLLTDGSGSSRYSTRRLLPGATATCISLCAKPALREHAKVGRGERFVHPLRHGHVIASPATPAIAAPTPESSSGTLWGHRARRGRLRDDQRRAKCAIYFMPGGRLELPRPCGQRILRSPVKSDWAHSVASMVNSRSALTAQRRPSVADGSTSVSSCARRPEDGLGRLASTSPDGACAGRFSPSVVRSQSREHHRTSARSLASPRGARGRE